MVWMVWLGVMVDLGKNVPARESREGRQENVEI